MLDDWTQQEKIFAGKMPFATFNEAVVTHRVVNLDIRPARPVEGSQSWSTWGLTDGIWSLMADFWKKIHSERPTMEQVSQRLSNLGVVQPISDSRARTTVLFPAHFRETLRVVSDMVTVDELRRLVGIHEPTPPVSEAALRAPPLTKVSFLNP